MKNNIQVMTFVAAISTVFFVNGFTTTSKLSQVRVLPKLLSSNVKQFQKFHLQRTATATATSTSTRLFASSVDKARVLFLGTPDVAATTLQQIVEESQKDER